MANATKTNPFPGPETGEDVQILTALGSKSEGKGYGVFDDAIVLQNKDGDFEVCYKRHIVWMLIKNTEQQTQ